jgi:hypothetical protein
VKALIVPTRLLIFIGMLLLGAVSSAQTIGNWTFNNILTGTGSALNTVSAISAGPGIPTTAFNGGTEWYGQNGFPAGASPSANAYLQFAITPNSGYELNIASIVLRMRRSNTGSPSGSGPTQWCLRSSLDGYTANLATGSMTHNYANYTVVLTGFNQLATGVTFRLYGYSVTVGSGGNSRLVLDNVSITGSLFILPLHLDAPEARADEPGNIAVAWKAYDVSAGTSFRLQRSADGASFETVYTAIENADKIVQRYTYTDRSAPAGSIYYRVQAVEPGGTEQFSRIISISRKISARLHIDKIAVRGSLLQATVQTPVKGNYTIVVHSSTGMQLYKQVVSMEAGAQPVMVPLQLVPRGMCVLSVYDNGGVVSKSFVR